MCDSVRYAIVSVRYAIVPRVCIRPLVTLQHLVRFKSRDLRFQYRDFAILHAAINLAINLEF